MAEFLFIFLFGPPSNRGSYKITVVCLFRLSVHHFGIFVRNGSLVFSGFLHIGKLLEYLKTYRALFSRKILFCPHLIKKDPKWFQNRALIILGQNTIGPKYCWQHSLKWNISRKKWMTKFVFDMQMKHFLQVDTITLGEHSQGCQK